MQTVGVQAIWDNSQFLQGQAQYVNGINKANTVTGQFTSQTASMGAAGASGLLPMVAIGSAIGNVMANVAMQAVAAISKISSFAVTSVAQLQDLEVTLESLSARELLATGTVQTMGEAMQYAAPMADQLMQKLQELSLASPFEYKDILAAFQVSMAFGMASDSAVEFTRAATNLAAVNKGIPDVLNRITYNFAQMGLQAKITQMDVRQLAQAGVDLGAMLEEGLGMTVEEASAALESGKITMAELSQAFVDYSDKYFGAAAQRASRTLGGLVSSFKDLAFFASADIFKPAFERIGNAMGDVFDKARGIVDSGVLKNIGALLDILAEQALIAAEKFGGWVSGIAADWGTTLSTVASDALNWGVNIAVNLATGLIQGAASAITAAMNFISGILSSWLAPGSPPRVAPDLPMWGASAMDEWLEGMTQADFSILNGIQGPLQDALNVMVSAGEITRDEMGNIFADVSESIIQALSTGQIDTAVFDQLREAAGDFGQELVELAQDQIALAQAEEQVTAAEQALTDARKRESDAGKAVNDATLEYNQLLRSGADKETLKAKMAQINASKKAQQQAKKDADAAENQVEAAKDNLTVMKEALALQQELLKTLIEIARAREQTEPTTAAGGAGAMGGGGGGGPQIDLSGITGGVEDAFENARQAILDKMSGIWDQIKAVWDTQVSQLTPTFDQLIAAWNNLVIQAQPVIDWLKTTWDGFLQWFSGEVQYWTEFAATWWQNHGQSVITIVDWFIATVSDFISKSLTGWTLWWEDFGSAILGIANLAWESVKLVFSTYFEQIGLLLDAFAALTKGDWDTFWAKIQEIVSIGWEAVKTLFSNALGALTIAWSSFWLAIDEYAISAWGKIQTWIGLRLAELQKAWTDVWNSISSTVLEIWNDIYDGISSFDLYDAGVELLNGMISGIMDTVDSLVDSVIDAVEAAINAAYDALGIKSPSKVFLAVGENTMNALAKGIMVTADVPKLAMQSAISGVAYQPAPVPIVSGSSYRTMNLSVTNNVNSQMDVFALEALIVRTVRKALST